MKASVLCHDRKALTSAFSALANRGYVVKQDCLEGGHKSVGLCLCDLAIEKAELGDPEVKGVVYYYKQDGFEPFSIFFTPAFSKKIGQIGKSPYSIGREVEKVLEAHGVPVEWCGDPTRCIVAIPTEVFL